MLLRPLRRAPMVLGGVGFQAGLDEVRRKPMQPARDVVGQIKELHALVERYRTTLTPSSCSSSTAGLSDRA